MQTCYEATIVATTNLLRVTTVYDVDVAQAWICEHTIYLLGIYAKFDLLEWSFGGFEYRWFGFTFRINLQI